MKHPNSTDILRRSPSELVIVLTDLCESEQLLKERSLQARRLAPDRFAGETPCVFFKFPYVPPCDRFQELRRLILAVHSHSRLRADYRGVVALEVSEWVGHEQEEYFTVVLKYLYDHRSSFGMPVFVLKEGSVGPMQRFVEGCARFHSIRLVDETIFSHEQRLEALLLSTISARGRILTPQALRMLTAALIAPEHARRRSLPLVERTVEELILHAAPHQELNPTHVEEYLSSPRCTLSLQSGKSTLIADLFAERSHDHVYENVSL